MAGSATVSGYLCQFDDQDRELFESRSWYVTKNSKTLKPKPVGLFSYDGDGKVVAFHRIVMDAPSGVCVDHINGDPLDNRRANLRFADKSENARNRGPDADNRSGYKGVYLHQGKRQPVGRPWVASIQVRRKRKHLGCFETAEAAYAAYCEAARELHGEFAKV